MHHKQKFLFRTLSMIVLAMLLSISVSFAHEGVTHETEEEEKTHTELSNEQMETIIELLQKLVVLLTYKMELARSKEAPVAVSMPVPHEDEATEEVHEHDEEMEVITEVTNTLKIEVEEHNGSTHVHVRYVDKPESMFFIQIPLSDRSGIVREVALKTGLSEGDVDGALVFVSM
jgi:hypothetical protein